MAGDIRGFELRLLRCSIPSDNPSPVSPPAFPPPTQPSSELIIDLHILIDQIVRLIECGRYIEALSSDAARTVFKFDSSEFRFTDSSECADKFYSHFVLSCVESFVIDENRTSECNLRVFLVMAIAVAALLAFTQCNITGPMEELPLMPLMGLFSKEGGSWMEWEGWAKKEITSVGSDLLGKSSYLQYIVFAKMSLMKIKDLLSEGKVSSIDGVRTISWWMTRALLIQQKLLDERSSSLFDLLQVFTHESLNQFGTQEKVIHYWGVNLPEEEAMTIVSILHLEAGIMEFNYGRVDSSRMHFESAEVASRLNLSVTGALGFRTIHQVEPKAQRLLVVGNDGASNYVSGSEENNLLQDPTEKHEASDVLMAPRYLGDDKSCESSSEGIKNSGITASRLKAVQQAVVLAQCLSIEKSSRQDELQGWDMAPYIEAIDSQPSVYFIIQCFCDVLRIRWESTRSRTKQRALLMMDKLVQNVSEPSTGVLQRIYYCFGVNFPTISALRKEYGDLLVSCGLIGEAVKVYEDLELWDNLIFCYQLLQKKAAAVDLIKTRLSEMPNDPKLWCSLGDVTNNDACYQKAIEVSGNRSARAKRSLARSAYEKGDYESSTILWESAMRMNSLYPDGWFAFGAAALKAKDVEQALDAFTHAVQLDPENGEAWNNIACLHMIKKKSKESFIAFKEALKFKRNSWQLWENYSHVAADVGNFGQAMEAVQTVLNMTKNKRVDTEFLERLMLEIEGPICKHSQNPVAIDEYENSGEPADYEGKYSKREKEHLTEFLGKILQQIVRSDGKAEIWGLYARWHKLKGDLTMCSEALLKQVRSYQGSDLWNDRDRFTKFAHASIELCNVYMEIASTSNSRRELFAAEMHLKNTIKQAVNFSETEELRNLQNKLDEVRMKLEVS